MAQKILKIFAAAPTPVTSIDAAQVLLRHEILHQKVVKKAGFTKFNHQKSCFFCGKYVLFLENALFLDEIETLSSHIRIWTI